MPRTRLVALTVAAVLVPAVAVAAPDDLVLKKVTNPPKKVAAGSDFTVKVKVKNTDDKPRTGKITMTLTDGPRTYTVPRRVGRFSTGAIEPGFFRRQTVRLTVPGNLGAGRYRLTTCLKSGGAKSCRVSRKLRVTASN